METVGIREGMCKELCRNFLEIVALSAQYYLSSRDLTFRGRAAVWFTLFVGSPHVTCHGADLEVA